MSKKSSGKHFKLEKLFSPQSPWEFLGLATVTTMINLISALNPIGFIGVAAIAFLWWWFNWERAKGKLRDLRFSPTKQPPNPAKGLILLLSPYSPHNTLLKSPEQLNPLIDKICQTSVDKLTQADFEAIDLFNSNLVPQIEAVKYHINQGKLKEVWLISSKSEQTETGIVIVQGSENTVIILEKYLNFQYRQRIEIQSQGLSVKDGDYATLYQIVNDIFCRSDYKDEVIIADITGGTKMMSVALAMACIPPKRKMQYMDSKRDWQGYPLVQGNIQPVMIDIDSILYSDD